MRTFEKRPALRWIAPAAALTLAVGGVLGGGVLTANADVTLPELTAEQLVAKVAAAKTPDFSGTVTETADLGLPSLPTGGSGRSVDFTSLLTGTNTLQVYVKGEDKSRVSLTGSFGESDVVRNGSDVWTWNSKAKTATRIELPAGERTARTPANPAQVPTTPEEAAKRALAAADDSTTVTLDRNRMVAGQKAYELVLTPKATDTLVGSVRIAVDGQTFLPLGIDVYPKATPQKAAFSMDYTAIDYTAPADSTFDFSPPSGTKVTEQKAPDHAAQSGSLQGSKRALSPKERAELERKAADQVRTVGDGWSSVLIAKVPSGAADQTGQGGSQGGQADQWRQLLQNLPTVQGRGWTGHALNGTLFSAVLTDDGRVAVGAVPVDRLVSDLG
ncbi:outer membrane lipoprotein-sorting protein [Friedmanniella endophytica]|uniref:Outer membrane lipoprotein-sorting protein n=1 Tax=Microlunatus kandeliicorticis TaxID=1759536 RepID=A0A7W3P4T9_9ACTN|nr:hypothetical protein [Microlunatus kandeliicorticis]MBA8793155.1 outer membrane lipoprotein-sorting protein [Microlunatus kandeliicorticis]